MKIVSETSIRNFGAWSGAVDTQTRIIDADMVEDFDSMIEESYPDGLTDTQLNDLLWFESDWIYESLGMTEEEDEDEE